MVTNETQTFIYQVIDTNQEYNTKILLFLLVGVYLLVMLWLGSRLTKEEEKWKKLTGHVLRLPASVMLVFYPMFVLWFYRTMSLDTILTNIYIVYGMFMSVVIVIGIIFGYEFLAGFLGLSEYFKERRRIRR